MKVSLALGNHDSLTRETAWGCLTTNLALPGFGSLVGGRTVGYVQAALCMTGLALTMIFGVRFIVWYFANYEAMNNAPDPFGKMGELWRVLRWPMLGFAIFGVSWLWALVTSWSILRSVRKAKPPPLPGGFSS